MNKIEKYYNGYIIYIFHIKKNKWKYKLVDGLSYKYLFNSEEIEAETQEEIYQIALNHLKNELFNF